MWFYLQAEAAGQFLNAMRRYLESLCSNLRSHTITNVQSNNDKVIHIYLTGYCWDFYANICMYMTCYQ